MDEFLIDGLWILEIESGSCLFEENYKKWSSHDTQLISSFLTAIRSFTKEAFSEDIEFIQFKSRKIIFKISGRILFIFAVTNSDLNEEYIGRTLKKLITRFNDKYYSILDKCNLMREFKAFKTFTNDLRQIIDRKPLNILLISDRKIDRLYKKRNERRMRRIYEMKRCA